MAHCRSAVYEPHFFQYFVRSRSSLKRCSSAEVTAWLPSRTILLAAAAASHGGGGHSSYVSRRCRRYGEVSGGGRSITRAAVAESGTRCGNERNSQAVVLGAIQIFEKKSKRAGYGNTRSRSVVTKRA